MAKRKTEEQFITEMNKLFPNLRLLGPYANVNVKTLFECLQHDFQFEAYPCNILAGHGCRKCGAEQNAKARRKPHEQFVEEMAVINPDINIIGQYIDAKTKILVRCNIDGYSWYADPKKLRRGVKCAVCTNRVVMIGVNDVATTHPQYIKYFKNQEDARKYVSGSEEYIDVICPKCGYEKKMRICNLIRFGFACDDCYERKYGRKRVPHGYWNKNTIEEYLSQHYAGYQLLDIQEASVDGALKVYIKCTNENHPPYWAYWTNIISGYTCLLCHMENSMSKGEKAAEMILKKYHYTYEPQKRFCDCRDKYVLPFDFYLPEYNLVVEIMGEQHEHPINYFGGQEKFEIQIRHDKIKRDYLKQNNIHCLDVWYYEFDQMESMILNKIQEIVSK